MMIDTRLRKIAVELVAFLADFKNAGNLRRELGARKVIAQSSSLEPDRTIEIEVLTVDGEQLEVSGFSDGWLGTVGVIAMFYSDGMSFRSKPRLFVNGVPSDEIDLND